MVSIQGDLALLITNLQSEIPFGAVRALEAAQVTFQTNKIVVFVPVAI
jgi:hypothetical protein